jgi:hypothetical protein
VPAILGIALVTGLDLELGFDGVSDAATEQRLGVGVAIGLEMIIGPLLILEPKLIGPVRPFAAGMRGHSRTHCSGECRCH